jgi:hypothetical protein
MSTYKEGPEILLNGKPIRGEIAVREFHREMGFSGEGSFSDILITERRRYRASDAVVIEQTLSGKHTGIWQGLLPTGRMFNLDVCTIYKFGQDGKLSSESVYLDFSWLRRQLERGLGDNT